MTIPRKSRSSKREYRLTQKGKEGGSKNGGTELGVPENVNISRTSLLGHWKKGDFEPLLLIATYVLDFLCIHPFLDGNGRMARLLTLLLLYKAGYEVGRYISLEKMVEETKESYYDTLLQSSQGWHRGRHSVLPWWEYFLGVMLLGAYREFEGRVGLVTSRRGSKTKLALDTIRRFTGDFTVRDVQERCPNIGVDLLRRILREERNAGRVKCLGRGPTAKWRNR